jgi:hypothetical protein
MGLLFAAYAAGLALIALRQPPGRLRWWLLAFAALNAAALGAMLLEDDPFLWRLMAPDEGAPEPAWRR